MTQKSELENLVRVKTALAEKYERQVISRKSQTGKATAKRMATRYREQAASALRGGRQ
jgi:hypothetical protein